jgi:hypothetical protein
MNEPQWERLLALPPNLEPSVSIKIFDHERQVLGRVRIRTTAEGTFVDVQQLDSRIGWAARLGQ